MDFFDYHYKADQSFFSAFGGTSQTQAGKKTTTNHFDAFITPFDQLMIQYFPFSDDIDKRTGERTTIMSHLVDKMQAQTEILKMQIMKARQNMEVNGNTYDVKLKCLDIAFRISGGDKVSIEELNFLKAYDPELYNSAMNK